MIEKFKQFRFEFDKQKEEYSKIKGDITEENKYVLLDEINKESIWNYFQLSIEILFDLASDSEKYLEYLDSVFLKVKGDMASGPFFEMLIKVGKEKQEVAIKLYYIIQNKSNNIDLKIISGLILGGYSFYNEGLLKDLIKRNLEYPTKNTILKAILVKYEKEILPTEVKECLNKTMLSHDERILTELMNLYLSFYKNEKSYFYEKIKSLAERKIISVNRLLFWKTIGIKLDKEHILELIELYKNSEETIINDMMYPLIDYPDEIEKISKLFIYWINKDLEFKVQHFDWAIQELVKKNEKFIDYFLDNFEKVKTEKLDYKYIFPRIFEKMASQNVEFASRELMEKKIFDKDPKLYYELVSKIIGIIYKDQDKKKAFNLFFPLAKKIEEISENKDFINENKKTFDELVNKNNFDELINYINGLLEQLRFRIIDFEFNEIDESLKEFSELDKIIKHKLKELYNKKRYSPLFWLGSQQRDKELKKAYLNEIENFLSYSKNISNERNKDNRTSLIRGLENEDKFWDDFSEIIFTNKFIFLEENLNSILEPKIPNKNNNADLYIKLNNKNVFFEIKNSKGDRSLHLDNGAVTINNKVDKILKEKSSQFYSLESFEEMKKGIRNDLYFIVVDASSSVIDEYMIANSFFGTLTYQFYRNNETGETTKPELIRKDDAIAKDKQIVSGLIYFKKQLVNLDGKVKFILVGDIILNPYAVNQPTVEEIKKLKEIIF
ncbi:MAG: hypothetical protein QT05_C0049G0010 [archaeon GW2011_AR13]|nr:MAG: hypothetical protein QT05_C0049G0010 [archaeon GW2011_AR13]HIG94293.1 hypothetical protein [Nanoarchaeota archaeon]HIH63062.1 hypothetical protein [Nanoarchaeota archaeon]HIJ09511.1 hypothetical protein [Nanoarchaeota archaeon]